MRKRARGGCGSEFSAVAEGVGSGATHVKLSDIFDGRDKFLVCYALFS